MGPDVVVSQADLGRRIAEAREASGRTQASLADALRLERTAIVRVESGQRKVSATELIAIAAFLERPIDWFVSESPPAVVSRRRDPAIGGFSKALDRELEDAVRDVDFLMSRQILTPAERSASFAPPSSFAAAENLARLARAEVGTPDGPLLDIQSVAESV